MASEWQRQVAAQRRADAAAARQAAREAEQARKLQYEASRKDEASRMTAEVEQRVRDLNSIHTVALTAPAPTVDFDALKRRPTIPKIDLGADSQPIPPPDWRSFEPRSPGTLGRLLGGNSRYAQQRSQAEDEFDQAVEEHKAAEIARQRRVAAARQVHAEQVAALTTDANNHNAAVDRFAMAVRSRDRHAVSTYFQMMIDNVRDPQGFPPGRRAAYVPESSLLAIEWYLPGPEIVPTRKSFRWVKTRDEFTETERPPADIRG